MNIELIIQNDNICYIPEIAGDIIWKTNRQGTAGELKFNILYDDNLKIEEGNAVKLTIDNQNVFFGFIFTKSQDKENIINITAYDQLRYLKNKDTYVFENKSAMEIIKIIANDFVLNIGSIENTKYKIESRIEENTSLFDMIQNALDITLQNTNEMYVLYDDCGKLTLKNISNMTANILIDSSTAENFEYLSSIDNNTYNKIKLVYNNEKTKTRDVYITKDSNNINKWGVLQYYDTLQDGENGKIKADALLNLYNQKTKMLRFKKVFGHLSVRAGSMVAVQFKIDDININNLMLVESCTHTFNSDTHFMDIELKGGGISG